MNERLPHDYKSVTRALAQDYKIKCTAASGNGSLKELTRGWKQASGGTNLVHQTAGRTAYLVFGSISVPDVVRT